MAISKELICYIYFMKKIFYLAFVLLSLSACKDNNGEDEVSQPISLVGTWKIDHYEFKGKTYNVTSCDKDDVIVIQAINAGSYKNSEWSPSINACDYVENYVGTWLFIPLESKLVLNYRENMIDKTKTINLTEYSSKQLKIDNNTKNIDGIPGNDAAVEVWVRQ